MPSHHNVPVSSNVRRHTGHLPPSDIVLAPNQFKTFFRYFAAVFMAVLVLSIWRFGQPIQPTFSAEAKTGIERIAKGICAAANEPTCQITWSGKHRWFGTLAPVSSGQAIAGIDHIRAALIAPAWVERAASDGITFSDDKYEVFFSSASGAITITTLEHTP